MTKILKDLKRIVVCNKCNIVLSYGIPVGDGVYEHHKLRECECDGEGTVSEYYSFGDEKT